MADGEPAERSIFWVYHWYQDDERNLKTIGHFSDERRAREAIETVKSQPGFRDHPEGFEIDECRIDQVCWQDGFGVDD